MQAASADAGRQRIYFRCGKMDGGSASLLRRRRVIAAGLESGIWFGARPRPIVSQRRLLRLGRDASEAHKAEEQQGGLPLSVYLSGYL